MYTAFKKSHTEKKIATALAEQFVMLYNKVSYKFIQKYFS